MITKRKLIGSALLKEIVSIRIDTLWRMLKQRKAGELPGVYDEGATGRYDNKGAIFIPGGLIYQDVDERSIVYERLDEPSPIAFRKAIREAMRYDNATLLYPDGIAYGINLDSGFFSRAARRIYTFKKAAFRRKRKVGSRKRLAVLSDDIIRSHCPTYFPPPYGARTRVSTCAAVGLIDPPMFLAYCETHFNLSSQQADNMAQCFDMAQESVAVKGNGVLYPPYIVVCHDTRYSENCLTGLTRLLGIGKFGEFATFSLEIVNHALVGELKRKHQEFSSGDLLATFDDDRILGILRVYHHTNIGKRSLRYDLHIVSPGKDLDLDIDRIEAEARQRYQVA
jgi:hypothetical protein